MSFENVAACAGSQGHLDRVYTRDSELFCRHAAWWTGDPFVKNILPQIENYLRPLGVKSTVCKVRCIVCTVRSRRNEKWQVDVLQRSEALAPHRMGVFMFSTSL